ncbi:MAG: hypothetical protein ACTHOD_19620 [Motilibacteraceae bacterium]
MRPTRGPSLAERADARRAQEAAGPAPQPPVESARPWPRHCCVHPADGRPHLPGLLLEWRRDDDGTWLGRVAIGTLDGAGRAQMLEQSVEAAYLEPT